MSDLPEYFRNPKAENNVIQWMSDTREALAIAWEALEHYSSPGGEYDYMADKAMRRIEELGK